MPEIFGAEITGHEKFKATAAMMMEDVRRNIEKAVIQGMTVIVGRAQDILEEKDHVKTGNLKRSVQPLVNIDKNEIDGMAGSFLPGSRGFVGADAPYAPRIEALPDGGYLYPAYIENKDHVQKWIADAIIVRIMQLRKKL